jgi:PhnB protein
MTSNAVRPKLVVADADADLRWYADHLDAVEVARYAGGGSIVFAELTVCGTTVTLKHEGAACVTRSGSSGCSRPR